MKNDNNELLSGEDAIQPEASWESVMDAFEDRMDEERSRENYSWLPNLLDDDGFAIMEPVLDENGKPMLDPKGYPIEIPKETELFYRDGKPACNQYGHMWYHPRRAKMDSYRLITGGGLTGGSFERFPDMPFEKAGITLTMVFRAYKSVVWEELKEFGLTRPEYTAVEVDGKNVLFLHVVFDVKFISYETDEEVEFYDWYGFSNFMDQYFDPEISSVNRYFGFHADLDSDEPVKVELIAEPLRDFPYEVQITPCRYVLFTQTEDGSPELVREEISAKDFLRYASGIESQKHLGSIMLADPETKKEFTDVKGPSIDYWEDPRTGQLKEERYVYADDPWFFWRNRHQGIERDRLWNSLIGKGNYRKGSHETWQRLTKPLDNLDEVEKHFTIITEPGPNW